MIDSTHSACSVLGYRLTKPASAVRTARQVCKVEPSTIVVSDEDTAEAERCQRHQWPMDYYCHTRYCWHRARKSSGAVDETQGDIGDDEEPKWISISELGEQLLSKLTTKLLADPVFIEGFTEAGVEDLDLQVLLASKGLPRGIVGNVASFLLEFPK
eukprot:8792-Heterococcus_DN1.PRE.2